MEKLSTKGTYLKDNGKMVRKVATEPKYIIMGLNLQELSKMISNNI